PPSVTSPTRYGGPARSASTDCGVTADTPPAPSSAASPPTCGGCAPQSGPPPPSPSHPDSPWQSACTKPTRTSRSTSNRHHTWEETNSMTDVIRALWRRLPDWVKRLSEIGVLPSDSDELRVRKAVLVLSSTLMASLSFVW